jgi:outer membrane protein assembly factor BamB
VSKTPKRRIMSSTTTTIALPHKGPRHPCILLALGIIVSLVTTSGADWPHLRGANYDAIATETGLAESWPADGPPQLWRRELGSGYSGFIVAEGKAYTQHQTLGGQYLLCLDPDTGQTVWESRYDWPWQPKGAYPGPYATPTWYRGRVYYASPTGLVGCVDAKTGASLWSLNVLTQFKGKGCEFGYAATPLVDDDRVVLPVGGPSASLVALHAYAGHTVWAAGSDPASYCPALPIAFQGRRCVVGYLQNALVIADLTTGKLLHRQPLSSGYDEHSAWPLYQEPHLLLASPFRVPAERWQLELGPADSLLCRPQWSSREMCNDIASSVLFQGHVYGFDLKQLQASKHRPSRGAFKCLDWSTGKVCWSTDRVGHAAVLVADGKLFLVNDTGSLVLARADPAEYREEGRTQLFEDETCWAPPTLSDGRLFVRGESQAVGVFVGRSENAPAALASATPGRSVHSWRFDPNWLLSREREFPNDAPSWEEMELWFGACVLLVFGGAALGAALAYFLAKRFFGRQLPGSLMFLGLAFVLGFLGPNVFSSLLDRCLFTWPASLYAAFHATLLACWWAEQHPGRRRARWLARLAIVGFLLVGYAYFELCKTIGMFIGWSFLFGFLAASPFTFLAARRTEAAAVLGRRRLDPAGVRRLFLELPGPVTLEDRPGSMSPCSRPGHCPDRFSPR